MAVSYSKEFYENKYEIIVGNLRHQAQNLAKDEGETAPEDFKGREGAYIALYTSSNTDKSDMKSSKKNQFSKYTEIRYQQQEGDPKYFA